MAKKKKEKKPEELDCVVEVDEEIRGLCIRRYDDDEECPFQVWLSGDLDDSSTTAEEILDAYGEFYWKDLDDFAANRKNGKSLKDWLAA